MGKVVKSQNQSLNFSSIAEIRPQRLDEPFDNYLHFSTSQYPFLLILPFWYISLSRRSPPRIFVDRFLSIIDGV